MDSFEENGPAGAGTAVVADFGGTNARFATVGDGPRDLSHVEVFPCSDYASLEDALEAYLRMQGIRNLAEASLSVAGPVDKDIVDLPNNHWMFSKSQLEARLGAPLTVINDFTAQALCIDILEPEEVLWIGAPRPNAPGIRTLIGPGTGLGVAVLMPGGDIIPSEAGHVGFAATSEHEIQLLRALFARYRRVSIERLVSGPGLENLYWANRRISQPEPEADQARHSPREISEMALAGDPLAQASIEDFFDILASFAGDMALATWATGGIYLSGGVVQKLNRYLDAERFRARFEDKGRFTRFCEEVPVAWIRAQHPGLLGCAVALRREITLPGLPRGTAPGSGTLPVA
ncbi:MAG: glucokinase [Gemmatimonadales bacterium]|nr:MAG: glucokinase [Gemmatimonadales bacterium]